MQKKLIPNILHTIWIGNSNPNIDFRNSWNVFDNWKHYHWNDESILKEFNNNTLLKTLYQNEGPTKTSDYVRLLLLQKYGGVYVDIDTVFLKPIDEFLYHKAFITYQFSKITNPKHFFDKGLRLKDHFEGKNKISLFDIYNIDIYLNNSIIGSMPNSKFINTFLDVFKEDYAKPLGERFSFVDYGCGPAMTTYVGNLFSELDGSTKHTEEVSIYDSSYFHPYNYIENKDALKTRNFKKNLQKQIEKGKELGSYCVHIQSSSEVDMNYRKQK